MTALVRAEPGQVWAARSRFPSTHRTVTAVDGAQVLTDHGRTTVFALNRDWRPLDASTRSNP